MIRWLWAFLLITCVWADDSLKSGQVYPGDYFASDDGIEISGLVQGDVYLVAGQAIIDGRIEGDLLVAGGSVDISGQVLGNVRVIGGQVLVSGHIGRNLSVMSGNAQLLPSATIEQNVSIMAGNVDIGAKIGKNVRLMASNVRLSGIVGQQVSADVGQLHVTSKAQIGGALNYQSGTEASIDEGAQIGGPIAHQLSVVNEWIEGTWIQHVLATGKVLATLMNFLYTLGIGLVILKMFPQNLAKTVVVLSSRPWKACIWGIGLMIFVPLLCIILLMTVLGAPFALTLLALNIVGFYTAKIYSIFWATSWVFRKAHFRYKQVSTLILGLIGYFCLVNIPGIGFILSLLAMWLGLGAAVMAQARERKS